MKTFFTLGILLLNASIASAQWSNTTNLFADSLHMPVSFIAGEQLNPITIQSFPDSGYFFIWEDGRNAAASQRDIYAQKYDKTGALLWTVNGVPVVNGTNDQHFTYSSNEDYRTRPVAASDNAGGFYLCYIDDSIAGNDWQRIGVQHMRSNGSPVFPGTGYIVDQTPVGQTYELSAPQLIADDNGGFYVAYIKKFGNDNIYIYGYRDEGGTMKLNGGGLMNENGQQKQADGPCIGSVKQLIASPGTTVSFYNIWSDLQGGCNIAIAMNGNDGAQGNMLCYNRVWKAKKDASVTVSTLFPTGDPNSVNTTYKKGDVDVLYKLRKLFLDRSCTSPAGHFFWTDEILLSNGYQLLDQSGYDYNYPKGTTVSTSGNINVELIASTRRTFVNPTPTNFTVEAIGYAVEKFDSVPYQRASNSNPETGFNEIPPASLNKLNDFRDTLLAPGVYFNDFSLAGGGREIYCSGLMGLAGGAGHRDVRLQHLSVEQKTTDSFAIEFKTSGNKGELIGAELSTGAGSSDILYDFPLVAVNNTGNALFYIREYSRYVRVSPIVNGAELAWGAMGKPIGTPYVNNILYLPEQPYISLDAANGTGVVTWQDVRNPSSNTGTNIFMRHLDSINVVNYTPVNKKVQLFANGNITANPAVLYGSSKKYSTIEATNASTGVTAPVVEILDNYNLGAVKVDVYQHTGTVRTFNGKAYLDRNFTVTPQNNPGGAATVNLRLFFTATEFDALKAADATVTDPGSLAVVKQPNTTGIAPDSYAPVTGETMITPVSWKAVDGGYYIEIAITGFSNFFIQKAAGALPVTWLGVQAQWQDKDDVKVSWQVANQQQVKDYTVQHSVDGNIFVDACSVTASDSTAYSCVALANGNGLNYYRVMQRDLDGKKNYSKVVVLQRSGTTSPLSVYPNPAKDRLYIDGLDNFTTLSIIDLSGRLISSQAAIPAINHINVSQLPRGMYFLRLTGKSEVQIIKFLKE